jgi:hypothetical protein
MGLSEEYKDSLTNRRSMLTLAPLEVFLPSGAHSAASAAVRLDAVLECASRVTTVDDHRGCCLDHA